VTECGAAAGSDFELGTVLQSGSLPVIWKSSARQESLQAYVQLYLKEEIQAEALVRNLPGFARFLPTAALFHGQVLNLAGLARDAGVARTTVEGYLSILGDTHMAWLLAGYEGKLRVKAKERLERRDFAGLDAIGELVGMRRRLVVYLGERPFTTAEGVEVLPVPAFLAELESGTI